MKTKDKIALLFALITIGLLVVAISLLYISSLKNRENEYFELLKKEAVTKANLFFQAKVPPVILQKIYRNNRKILNEVEVAIYDKHFKLLYHDAVDIDVVKETPHMLNQIFKSGEIQQFQDDWQIIGLRFTFDGREYAITAAGYDAMGFKKLNYLLKTSILLSLVGTMLIFGLGRYFSNQVLEPIKKLTNTAKKISASSLNERIEVPKTRDEIAHLVNVINEMLDRLEHSFYAQKNLVTHISHELLTPLTSMLMELEWCLSQPEQNIKKETLKYLYAETKSIVRLSESLLHLAKAEYDEKLIPFKELRIDEVLMDAIQEVERLDPNYRIQLYLDEQNFDNPNSLCCKGNESLLKIAWINLMENACKYSNDQLCKVNVYADKKHINILFTNSGEPITQDDTERIFKPFARGRNAKNKRGSGIGLYLAKKIIHLHGADLVLNTAFMEGTQFKCSIPFH